MLNTCYGVLENQNLGDVIFRNFPQDKLYLGKEAYGGDSCTQNPNGTNRKLQIWEIS
jgi:hypothetical protein